MDELVTYLMKMGAAPLDALEVARKMMVGQFPGGQVTGNLAPEGLIPGDPSKYESFGLHKFSPGGALRGARDGAATEYAVQNYLASGSLDSSDPWNQATTNLKASPHSDYLLSRDHAHRESLALVEAERQRAADQRQAWHSQMVPPAPPAIDDSRKATAAPIKRAAGVVKDKAQSALRSERELRERAGKALSRPVFEIMKQIVSK